jgi:hypothetical protein
VGREQQVADGRPGPRAGIDHGQPAQGTVDRVREDDVRRAQVGPGAGLIVAGSAENGNPARRPRSGEIRRDDSAATFRHPGNPS